MSVSRSVCANTCSYSLCMYFLAVFSVIKRIRNKRNNSVDKQIMNKRTTNETHVQLNRIENRPETRRI